MRTRLLGFFLLAVFAGSPGIVTTDEHESIVAGVDETRGNRISSVKQRFCSVLGPLVEMRGDPNDLVPVEIFIKDNVGASETPGGEARLHDFGDNLSDVCFRCHLIFPLSSRSIIVPLGPHPLNPPASVGTSSGSKP